MKLLVVACNTASSVALDELRAQMEPLPVIGVVGPGAGAAVSARPGGSHLVLATEATVRLGAYRRAILEMDPTAEVREHACELLVALAEEGWSGGPIAAAIVKRYLDDADPRRAATSVILGCTHFPLLRDAIAGVLGSGVSIVDSASTTAAVTRVELARAGLASPRTGPGTLRLLATDGPTRFARVGGLFLGETLTAEDVTLVDL